MSRPSKTTWPQPGSGAAAAHVATIRTGHPLGAVGAALLADDDEDGVAEAVGAALAATARRHRWVAGAPAAAVAALGGGYRRPCVRQPWRLWGGRGGRVAAVDSMDL